MANEKAPEFSGAFLFVLKWENYLLSRSYLSI